MVVMQRLVCFLLVCGCAAATPCTVYCSQKYVGNASLQSDCLTGCDAAASTRGNTRLCACNATACGWGCNFAILCAYCSAESESCRELPESQFSFYCAKGAASSNTETSPTMLAVYTVSALAFIALVAFIFYRVVLRRRRQDKDSMTKLAPSELDILKLEPKVQALREHMEKGNFINADPLLLAYFTNLNVRCVDDFFAQRLSRTEDVDVDVDVPERTQPDLSRRTAAPAPVPAPTPNPGPVDARTAEKDLEQPINSNSARKNINSDKNQPRTLRGAPPGHAAALYDFAASGPGLPGTRTRQTSAGSGDTASSCGGGGETAAESASGNTYHHEQSPGRNLGVAVSTDSSAPDTLPETTIMRVHSRRVPPPLPPRQGRAPRPKSASHGFMHGPITTREAEERLIAARMLLPGTGDEPLFLVRLTAEAHPALHMIVDWTVTEHAAPSSDAAELKSFINRTCGIRGRPVAPPRT